MEIVDPAEIRLIEKYREALEKVEKEKRRYERVGVEVSRTFSVPSTVDSEEMRHISVGVRLSSIVPSMSEVEARVERAKIKV